MRKPRSVFILFVLLAFGVSLAVPAQDIPETLYDESEALPFESTPRFSGVVHQAPAWIAKAELSYDSLLRFDSLTKRCRRRRESGARSHWIPSSLTILDRSLRC